LLITTSNIAAFVTVDLLPGLLLSLINMQITILGLSKTGKLISERLLTDGHELIVWNSSNDALEEIRTEKAEFIVSQKLTLIHSIDEIRNISRKPRVLWSMLPSGEPTETMITQLNQFVEAGDIVADCSDSNFKDTERRSSEFEKRGIKFLGIGVAGGSHALEDGCCLMVGGNADAYQYVVPALESLSKPNGAYTYFGSGGAGHFVKMVHSGIESGMTQAIAEGIGILRKSDYQFDVPDVANTWQGGSIASSFLLDMVIDGLIKDPGLSQFDGRSGVSDLAKWALEQAKESNTPVPVTERAVEFSAKSEYDKTVQETTVAKIIQAMKKEIGG